MLIMAPSDMLLYHALKSNYSVAIHFRSLDLASGNLNYFVKIEKIISQYRFSVRLYLTALEPVHLCQDMTLPRSNKFAIILIT